jgi:hypothetical protein
MVYAVAGGQIEHLVKRLAVCARRLAGRTLPHLR